MNRNIYQASFMDDFDQALDEPPDDNDFGIGAGHPIAIDESLDELNDETFGLGEIGGDWETAHEVLVKAELGSRPYGMTEIAEVEEKSGFAARGSRVPYEPRQNRSYTYTEGLDMSNAARFDDETQFLRVEQSVSQIFDDSSDDDECGEVINLEDEEVSAINGHRQMRTMSESQSHAGFSDPAIIATASANYNTSTSTATESMLRNNGQHPAAADMQKITLQFGALFGGSVRNETQSQAPSATSGVSALFGATSNANAASSLNSSAVQAPTQNAPVSFTSFSEFLKNVQSKSSTRNQQPPNVDDDSASMSTQAADATVPEQRRGRGRDRVLQSAPSADSNSPQLVASSTGTTQFSFGPSAFPPASSAEVGTPTLAKPPLSAPPTGLGTKQQQSQTVVRPSKTRFNTPIASNGVIAMRAGAGQPQPPTGPPPPFMMPPGMPGAQPGPMNNLQGPPPLLGGPFAGPVGPGPLPFNGPPMGYQQQYRPGPPPGWVGPPPPMSGPPPMPNNQAQFVGPRPRNAMPPQPPSWARYWERQARMQVPPGAGPGPGPNPGPSFNPVPPAGFGPVPFPGYPPHFAPGSGMPTQFPPNPNMLPAGHVAGSPMRPAGPPFGPSYQFPRRPQGHRSASESDEPSSGPPQVILLRRPDAARGPGSSALPPPFGASSNTIAIGISNIQKEVRNFGDEYAGLMTQRDRDWVIKVQLSQLNSLNNYADDYYYVQWKMRKLQADGGTRLILPIAADADGSNVPRDELNNQNPNLFDGALGKVTKSSIHNPRRVIDIEVVANTALNEPLSLSAIESRLPSVRETLAAARAEVTETNDLRRLRRLLLEIEQLLELVLEIEDTEYKLHGLPHDRHAEMLGEKNRRITLLINRLSLLAKHGLLAVQKGRTLVNRACRLLDTSQVERLLALLADSARESVSLSPEIAKFVDSLLSDLSAKEDSIVSESARS